MVDSKGNASDKARAVQPFGDVSLAPEGGGPREASRGSGTMEPESSSRRHSGESLAARLPSSAAETPIDLRASVYEVLRCGFRSGRNGAATDGPDDDTHDAVRSVCAVARANEVPAESLILAIKAGWRQFPQGHGLTRLDAEVTLAELITMCIKEYYAPQRR